MLLCGVLDQLHPATKLADPSRDKLLSYFFCQATDKRINSATAVLRGLIYLLVDQHPPLLAHVRKKYDRAGKALFEDVNAWTALSEIFADIVQDASLGSTYLVVDALDEGVTDLPKLLGFINQNSSSSRVKWIVSSRNWPDIEEQLDATTQKVRLCLELNQKSISAAVSIYIRVQGTSTGRQKEIYAADTGHCPIPPVLKRKRHVPLGGLGLSTSRADPTMESAGRVECLSTWSRSAVCTDDGTNSSFAQCRSLQEDPRGYDDSLPAPCR